LLPPPIVNRSSKLTISQLVISVLGLFGSVIAVLSIAILNFAAPSLQSIFPGGLEKLPLLIWISLVLAGISILSIVAAIRGLQHKPDCLVSGRRFLFASIALLGMVPLLYVGDLGMQKNWSAWLAGLINLLVILTPLWWLVEFSRRKTPSVSTRRQWGLLAFGVFLSQPLIIFIEIMAAGIGIILLAMWFMDQAQFAPLLTQLQNQLLFFTPDKVEEFITQLQPLLMSPMVLIAGVWVWRWLFPLLRSC
jgi:hypothetical protein